MVSVFSLPDLAFEQVVVQVELAQPQPVDAVAQERLVDQVVLQETSAQAVVEVVEPVVARRTVMADLVELAVLILVDLQPLVVVEQGRRVAATV